jgi:SAM-dependent methyltransferase
VTRAGKTIEAAYFDALYARSADPWGFASSLYERGKYAATVAALRSGRYASALEVGCSIGVLTRDLAAHCDALLALDASEAPLAQARVRCADLPNVRFERMFAPEQWPGGAFDLILLSEVVYYFSREDVARLAARIAGSLAPLGDLVLVHWIGETNYPLSGDEAAELLIGELGEAVIVERAERRSQFRLDVLRRR